MTVFTLDLLFGAWILLIVVWLIYDIITTKHLKLFGRLKASLAEVGKRIWHRLGD